MGGWQIANPTRGNQNHNQPHMLLRQLRAGDIREVKALQLDSQGSVVAWQVHGQTRPVFRITFRDNSALVIKAESSGNGREDGKNLTWGAKLMRQVSPQLKVQLLTQDELAVLRASRRWRSRRGTPVRTWWTCWTRRRRGSSYG